MKFHQVTIGSHFHYQGKHYCKTGPLVATADDGSQRMVPRAATVSTADQPTAETTPRTPLHDSLQRYHQRNLDLLQDLQMPETDRQRLLASLEKHYREMLAELA